MTTKPTSTVYMERIKGRETGTFIAEVLLEPVMGKRPKFGQRFKLKDDAIRWANLCKFLGRRVSKDGEGDDDHATPKALRSPT